MDFQDYKYVDCAINGVENRNHVYIVNAAQFPGKIDCYRTYFRYPEQFKKHVETPNAEGKKSVKGYNGMAYADWFPVDIDDAKDLGAALVVAQDFLKRITINFDIDIKSLPIFFSGSKGFHIYLPAKTIGILPAQNIAQVFKKFAEILLTPWQIKYDSNIYDTTRLFRIVNTINSKSGLFKIPLHPEEVINGTIESICELAKNQRDPLSLEPARFNEAMAALYKNAVEMVEIKPRINGDSVDTSQYLPKDAKLCYLSLMKGANEGQRDASAYRLACFFRKQGFSENIVSSILESWNQLNAPPLPERELTTKIRSAFSDKARNDFGCNDEILKAHCDRSCFIINKNSREKLDSSIIKGIDEAILEYEKYVQNLQNKLCVIDIPTIGPLMRGVAPGEVLTMLARSGVGKTAMIINLLLWIGRRNPGMPQLFFTLEQPLEQVYERMAQVAMGIGGGEVEEMYTVKALDHKRRELEAAARKFFRNVLLVDKDFLKPEEMIEIVRLAEKKINKKIGVVAVDYLGRMKGGNKSQYEVVSENAQQIKHMAKELDVAMILLAQVSRAKGGDGTTPVEIDSARDSGQIEEASDFVIGMWRPDIEKNTNADDDVLKLKLLKNRKGPQGIACEMKFTKKALRIDGYQNAFWDFEPDRKEVFVDDELPF